MASPSLKTAQTETLKICMIQRALAVETVAAKCGVSLVTMRNQIAKNFPSRRLRLVVENFLQMTIWTSCEDFKRRQELSTLCGFDPFVLSVPALRQKVSQLKIRGRSESRKKKFLIGLIQQHFTAKHQNSQSTK